MIYSNKIENPKDSIEHEFNFIAEEGSAKLTASKKEGVVTEELIIQNIMRMFEEDGMYEGEENRKDKLYDAACKEFYGEEENYLAHAHLGTPLIPIKDIYDSYDDFDEMLHEYISFSEFKDTVIDCSTEWDHGDYDNSLLDKEEKNKIERYTHNCNGDLVAFSCKKKDLDYLLASFVGVENKVRLFINGDVCSVNATFDRTYKIPIINYSMDGIVNIELNYLIEYQRIKSEIIFVKFCNPILYISDKVPTEYLKN